MGFEPSKIALSVLIFHSVFTSFTSLDCLLTCFNCHRLILIKLCSNTHSPSKFITGLDLPAMSQSGWHKLSEIFHLNVLSVIESRLSVFLSVFSQKSSPPTADTSYSGTKSAALTPSLPPLKWSQGWIGVTYLQWNDARYCFNKWWFLIWLILLRLYKSIFIRPLSVIELVKIWPYYFVFLVIGRAKINILSILSRKWDQIFVSFIYILYCQEYL